MESKKNSPIQQTLDGAGLFVNELAPQRREFIRQECILAAKRMGQGDVAEKNVQVLQQAANDLLEVVMTKYRYMSKAEFSHVMKMGAFGELGDNVAVSSRTFMGWFRKYQPIRAGLLRDARAASGPPADEEKQPGPIPTPEEYRNFLVQSFLEGNETIFGFSYDILANNGFTDLMHEKRDYYLAMAKNTLKQSAQPSLAKSMRQILNENNVLSEAKRLAARDYIRGYIREMQSKNDEDGSPGEG